MSQPLRTARLAAALVSAAALLGACELMTSGGPAEAVIVHKEYIPASEQPRAECVGGTAAACAEDRVLERQCWRLDLEVRHPFAKEQAEKARREGKPPYWVETQHRCVFPSEFKSAKVGQTFTEPAVRY